MPVWTDGESSRLSTLWDDGLSARQIAHKLTDEFGRWVSRNAVIGRVHRLKLHKQKRGKSPLRARGPDKQPRIRRVKIARNEEDGRLTLVPRLPRVAARTDVWGRCEDGISIMSITERTCRWPQGEDNFTFCGHVVERGRYCSEHAALAYRSKSDD